MPAPPGSARVAVRAGSPDARFDHRAPDDLAGPARFLRAHDE
ncbi:hypothetical protein [Streptomyces lavendulocolor]